MSRFEEKLAQWKFKRIAVAYLITAAVIGVACAAAAGYVYRDRLSFAWQYSRVSADARKKNVSELQQELSQLASSSSDVVDILILDKSNNVTYSAKNSEFASGQFNLAKAGTDRNYLVSGKNGSAVFRFVKGDDFMLNSVFNTDFGEIRDEYRDENFFESSFSDKAVYMISFLGGKDSGNKIYIISEPTSVPGGALTLKIIAAAAVLMFMIYWVLLALWAYQNAAKAQLYPLLWGVVVLLTNVAGIIVYTLYKRGNATCPVCGASQSRLHLYCSSCGAKLGATCKNCGAQVGRKDVFCPNCGKKIE